MAMACSRCSRSSCMIAATGRPQWAHTPCVYFFLFFFNDTATTEIYTLSLHDALPICHVLADVRQHHLARDDEEAAAVDGRDRDRKSTRLNSSHSQISYAVFCLKKKKKTMWRAYASRLFLADPLSDRLEARARRDRSVT